MKRALRRTLVASAVAAALGAGAYMNRYEFHLARLIDADSYEGAVLLLPGLPYTVSVRVRGIDTPEISRPSKACRAHERALGHRAKAVAQAALSEATAVFIDWPMPDKYGGRLVADVVLVDSSGTETRIADRLIETGLAVEYHGGKKTKDWCAVAVSPDQGQQGLDK